jgi:hypothetical protein
VAFFCQLVAGLYDREGHYRQRALELRQQVRTEPNLSTRIELELLALGYDQLPVDVSLCGS